MDTRPHFRKPPHGFTLVELLAASAAAAVLMVGILSMVVLLCRDRIRMKAIESHSATERLHWFDTLRNDLHVGRSMKASRDGRRLELVGYGAIDPITGTRSGRAARVTYEIVATDAGDCLLRHQFSLDDLAHTTPSTQLAAVGITSLRIAGAATRPSEQAGDASAQKTLPEIVRITIGFADGSPPSSQLVLLR